jgi:hypothetical protein
MVNTNYIGTGNSTISNLSALDGQVNTNATDIAALQAGFRWIEKIKVVTGDDISSKSGTSETFTDDNTGGVSLTVGDRIVSTNAASDDNIYIVQAGAWTTVAVSTNDQFFVDYNLPGPVNEEGIAAYKYTGTTMEQVATFDFELADSINLTGGYAASAGDPTASDEVETAIAKLDGNLDAVNTSLGTAQAATHLGTFSGDIISDNTTVKNALQELETEIGTAVTPDDVISDQAVNSNIAALSTYLLKERNEDSAAAVTTATIVDEVLVDNVNVVHWDVLAIEVATPANKEFLHITALHNGTTSADATDVDWDRQRRKTGSPITGYDVDVVLNGTGGTQEMRLQVTSTDSVDVTLVKREVV